MQKSFQKVDNGIEAQKKVFELGSNFWMKALSWAKENRTLTEKDHQVMQIACSIQ